MTLLAQFLLWFPVSGDSNLCLEMLNLKTQTHNVFYVFIVTSDFKIWWLGKLEMFHCSKRSHAIPTPHIWKYLKTAQIHFILVCEAYASLFSFLYFYLCFLIFFISLSVCPSLSTILCLCHTNTLLYTRTPWITTRLRLFMELCNGFDQ